jgi:hypothetical protein
MYCPYCRFKYDREWEILKVHRGGRKKNIYENTLPGNRKLNIIWPDSVVVMLLDLHAEGRRFKSDKGVILLLGLLYFIIIY